MVHAVNLQPNGEQDWVDGKQENWRRTITKSPATSENWKMAHRVISSAL